MNKRTTVFLNGCFDGGLHFGHLQIIKYAKSLGDVLILAIDSDRRVRESKGVSRPINTAMERGEYLDQIEGVALVCEFDTDEELENLVKTLEVDIMVVGTDYIDKRVIGSEFATQGVKFFPRIAGYSTTSVIEGNNY